MKKIILAAVVTFSILGASVLFAHEGHAPVAEVKGVPWGFEGLKAMPNVHPIFVHFPIALLPLAFLFYLCGMFFKKENLLESGRWSLCLAALGTAAAVFTGLEGANTVMHDEEVHRIMMVHQNLGIFILIASVLLAGASFFFKKMNLPLKLVFLGLIGLINVLLLQQNDFGGRMVYQYGVGTKTIGNKAQPIVPPNHH